MTVITIRHVPDELNERIKARAKQRGQSVQQYLLRQLERIAEESPLEQRLAEVLEQVPKVDVPLDELRASWAEHVAMRDG